MRIMVTGAAGQLGAAIVNRFSSLNRGSEVHAFTHRDLDIADHRAVAQTTETLRPDVIINCAAYNDVDGAEEDATAALATNSLGVLALSRAASHLNATLVHYSTDFVFDGLSREPYTEESVTRPSSTYGMSKLLGEWFALETPSCYVLRVESLFGGSPAKSSIDRIIRALDKGESSRVFVDRTVSPSYVPDVAAATEQLLTRKAPFGLYHCVNTGWTTWLKLAEEAARVLGREGPLIPAKFSDARLRAARPMFCALSNQKLTAAGVSMPTWQDALGRHMKSAPGLVSSSSPLVPHDRRHISPDGEA